MNDLNSVIIQGTVKEDAEVSVSRRNTVKCSFPLIYTKSNSQARSNTFTFSVVVKGESAALYKDHLKKGSMIRMVGELREKNGQVIIVADHLSLKI